MQKYSDAVTFMAYSSKIEQEHIIPFKEALCW